MEGSFTPSHLPSLPDCEHPDKAVRPIRVLPLVSGWRGAGNRIGQGSQCPPPPPARNAVQERASAPGPTCSLVPPGPAHALQQLGWTDREASVRLSGVVLNSLHSGVTASLPLPYFIVWEPNLPLS